MTNTTRRAELIARQHNLVSDMLCAASMSYARRLEAENRAILAELDEIDRAATLDAARTAR